VNAIYEAYIHGGYRKITEHDDTTVKEKFIRAKYEQKLFMKPSPTAQ
jgi:hypothetical protein